MKKYKTKFRFHAIRPLNPDYEIIFLSFLILLIGSKAHEKRASGTIMLSINEKV